MIVQIALGAAAGGLVGFAASRFASKGREEQPEKADGTEGIFETDSDDKVEVADLESEDNGVKAELVEDGKPELDKLYSDGGWPKIKYFAIDERTYMGYPEGKRHTATYFTEDEILAGLDDDLEELEMDGVFAFATRCLVESGAPSVYVSDGGEVAYEVIASDANYLEAYNDALGYSKVDDPASLSME